MPEATNTTSIDRPLAGTRRTLFAGFASSAAAFAAVGITADAAAMASDAAQPNADAELIRLCAEFDALERELQDGVNGADTQSECDLAEVAAEGIRQKQVPLLDAICALPCTTWEGAAALAWSFVLWDDCEREVRADDPSGNMNGRLHYTLLRSLLAGAWA